VQLKREPFNLPNYRSQRRRINNPTLRSIRHTASNYLLNAEEVPQQLKQKQPLWFEPVGFGH
jgi:hypothetical protein